MTGTGPLVQLQISFTRLPWRIAPSWAVVAGVLAGNLILDRPGGWLQFAAALILADGAWGLLRQYAAVSAVAATVRVPAVLPYATADAPLARMIGSLSLPGEDASPGWQGALGGLAVTVALSALLGWQAVVLSLWVLVAVLLARLTHRRGDAPSLADALLDVGFPGLLGLTLGGSGISELQTAVLAVFAGFVALQWGVLRWARSGGLRRAGFWFGLTGLVFALVALQQPLALALGGVLLAPVAWLVASRHPRGPALAGPWLWATLMMVAVVIRF